jgi:hypothetical protein
VTGVWRLGAWGVFLARAVGTAMAQQPPMVAHCATAQGELTAGTTCDTVSAPLPFALRDRSTPDADAVASGDIAAALLVTLSRAVGTTVRGDSAWVFAHLDRSHVSAEITSLPSHRLRVVALYWSRQPDGTLAKRCGSDDTVDVSDNRPIVQGARLVTTLLDFARCTARETAEAGLVAGGRREPPSRRPGSTLVIPLLIALAVSPLVWWAFFRRPRPDFWRFVTRYPDKAYDWFVGHDEWIVIDSDAARGPKPDEREFEGPYLMWVPKLGGRRVAIYGRRAAMRESQQAFLRTHGLDTRAFAGG